MWYRHISNFIPNFFTGLCHWSLPTWTWSVSTITCNIQFFILIFYYVFSYFNYFEILLVILGQHSMGNRSYCWSCSWRLSCTGTSFFFLQIQKSIFFKDLKLYLIVNPDMVNYVAACRKLSNCLFSWLNLWKVSFSFHIAKLVISNNSPTEYLCCMETYQVPIFLTMLMHVNLCCCCSHKLHMDAGMWGCFWLFINHFHTFWNQILIPPLPILKHLAMYFRRLCTSTKFMKIQVRTLKLWRPVSLIQKKRLKKVVVQILRRAYSGIGHWCHQ